MERGRLASPGEAIPGLTGLRGIGAVWVLLFHWSWMRYGQVPVLDRGYMGVDLFFLLSGFVLTHVYLKTLPLNVRAYRKFLIVRLARIYPLHLFVLLCLAGAVLLVPSLTDSIPHADRRFSLPAF